MATVASRTVRNDPTVAALIRQATAGTRRPAIAPADLVPLPNHFWKLWFAGSFGAVAIGWLALILGFPGIVAGLYLTFGGVAAAFNIGCVILTRGYAVGVWAAPGRAFAVIAGWIGVGIVAAFLAAVAIILLLVALLLGAASD